MNKTAAFLVGTLAVVTISAPSALAAPRKKPITGAYKATASMPDPTNFVPGKYPVCAMNVPGSFDTHPFTIPAAGTLRVEMSGFTGDWDMLLLDPDKEVAGESGNGPAEDEATDVSFKKATKITIVACNWAGTPTANVKYSFTFKK